MTGVLAPDQSTLPTARRQSRSARRFTLSMIALAYLLGALIVDPRAHLLTDVGGKTASLEAMASRGDWNPDIGYWFSDADQDGRFHPIAKSRQVSPGVWLNTTSLTMLLPAKPLWDLGGPRLVLLLPALGSFTAALAAGRLYRRLSAGPRESMVVAFAALGTPLFIYALDFWEHSWGVALTLLGVNATLDASEANVRLRGIQQSTPSEANVRLRGRQRWSSVAVAGLAYGLAATMRQEALVYGFVAGMMLTLPLLVRRRMLSMVGVGIGFATAALLPLVAHGAIEQALVGSEGRASRGATTLSSAGSALGDRIEAAATMLLFAFPSTQPIPVAASAVLVGCLGIAAVRFARSSDSEVVRGPMLIGWLAVACVVVLFGVGFVPGLLVAAPMTIFGIAEANRERRWAVLALAVGPVPLILATAFTDGLLVQWGGRYALATGLVMTVCAFASIERRSQTMLKMLMASAVLITLLGVAFTTSRSVERGADLDRILELTDGETVVWRNPNLSREFGQHAIGRPWLSGSFSDDQETLAPLLAERGIDRFHWIARVDAPEPSFPGFVRVERVAELDATRTVIDRYVLVGTG